MQIENYAIFILKLVEIHTTVLFSSHLKWHFLVNAAFKYDINLKNRCYLISSEKHPTKQV